MLARNLPFFLLLCIFFKVGLAAESPQDSLYEKALDAESAGNVADAILLFEKAASFPGRYGDEIREILSEYYEVLQIEKPDIVGNKRPFSLWGNIEAVASRYDEWGDTLGAREYLGEGFLQLGAEYEISSGSLTHAISVLFAAEGFLYEANTVFDTSRYEFSPSVAYSLSGKRLDLSAELGTLHSERYGTSFFASLFGSRDFYLRGNFRSGISGYGFVNSDARVRLVAGGHLALRKNAGINAEISLSGRLDGDTSVSAYVRYVPMDGLEEGEEFENVDALFFRDALSDDSGSFGVLADTVSERYYMGRRSKLGPEIRTLFGYRFASGFSVDFRGNLFLSFGMKRDEWLVEKGISRSFRRAMLQGSARIRAGYEWKFVAAYLSLESYFYRYFGLPSGHPELSAYAATQEKVRSGVLFRF